MKNYIPDIAKINKSERFQAITTVLKANGIPYRIQSIPRSGALGNIIVEFNPSKGKKIVISAHYDNYEGTPGANDNAAACSILLNLILDFKATLNHLEFVFFDLEEKLFVGSRYYIGTNPNTIASAINLDMCGIGENIVFSQHYFGSTASAILTGLATKYGAFQVKRLPGGDAYSFIEAGISTLYIVNSTNHDLAWFQRFATTGFGDRSADFCQTMHKPNDTPEKVNIRQVEKIYQFVAEWLHLICT